MVIFTMMFNNLQRDASINYSYGKQSQMITFNNMFSKLQFLIEISLLLISLRYFFPKVVRFCLGYFVLLHNGNFQVFDSKYCFYCQIIRVMDLEYQSHGNVDIVKQLNRLDKLTSRLNLTLKDMPDSEPITKSQKQRIVKFVSNDKAGMLIKLMEKDVITADRQIGVKGTRWNMLHVCAKYDAVDCVKLILKKIYQQDSDEYLDIINVQTAEGYTPLMVSIIYQASKTLQLLLRLGGSDLGIMQSSKLRAYDLALNYQNEKAIQELIVYEDRCKNQKFINKQELMEQIAITEDKGWFNSCVGCLFDYLLCLNQEDAQNQQNVSRPLLQKFTNLLKGDEKVYEIDAVKIGSRRDIEDYQIQWKRLSAIQGQKFILFDSFKPLDICENQFSLRHNLILFQALSDYSWIVKRAISKIEDSNNKLKPKPDLQKFVVNLFKNFTATKIQVDQSVPFVKQRGQIMFLSNQNQIWPMMLQKGLAKFYSSYIQLNNIIPCEALEDITAFYSHSLPISAFSNESIVSNLQELSMKGYLILLEGRVKTDLNSSKMTEIYSILNYYQKGNTKKILVNCPNTVSNWKQSKQNRQLAMIKAHFNKHNQSCVWIDETKLDYYFKSVTICYLKENYLRNELKIKMKIKSQDDYSNRDILEDGDKIVKNYKKAIFFKFKIDKKIDDPIILQLVDMQTKHRFDLTSLSGWKNDGAEVMIHESQSQNCKELNKIMIEPGQYTCMYEISEKQIMKKEISHAALNKSIIRMKSQCDDDLRSVGSDIKQGQENKKKSVKINLGPQHLKQLMLLAWWVQPLQVQYLEQQIGTIEWLSHFKNYSISNWSYLMKDKKEEEDCFLYETVNQKTILLIRAKSVKKAYLQLLDVPIAHWNKSNSIIQGKLVETQGGNSIELIRQVKNPNFFYSVISNIPVEDFERKKRIRFLYEYE